MRDSFPQVKSILFFMTCFTNEDKDVIEYVLKFYLDNLTEDQIELTDEVFDILEKLEAWQYMLTIS